jgi:hypothetical protein
MDSQKNAIVVFTARSPERIVREGGSQAWVLNHIRANQCTWLVCTQNRHHADHGFSDATQPHGAGFLVGKISALRKSQEEGAGDRWLIAISAFARIDLPDLWDHGRNPVRYTSLEELGIDPDALEFQPMPEGDDDQGSAGQPASAGPTPGRPEAGLTIAEAKKALAVTFGVKPEAVEITIRG